MGSPLRRAQRREPGRAECGFEVFAVVVLATIMIWRGRPAVRGGAGFQDGKQQLPLIDFGPDQGKAHRQAPGVAIKVHHPAGGCVSGSATGPWS